jgi:hypothetical protein
MPKRYGRRLGVLLVYFALLLPLAAAIAGCQRSPARAQPTPPATAAAPAFVTAAAETAILQLIAAEREASRTGDLPLLTQLWAEDARIVDTRGTEDAGDDFVWPNRAAILDRYVVAVFPAPPPGLNAPPQPAITAAGSEVQAVNGQDVWRFVNEDGRWWIAELRY